MLAAADLGHVHIPTTACAADCDRDHVLLAAASFVAELGCLDDVVGAVAHVEGQLLVLAALHDLHASVVARAGSEGIRIAVSLLGLAVTS